MKNNYFVYCHTNKINGKKYIGITCKKKPEYRWGKNGKNYSDQIFGKAIEKYGWDIFEHEILYSNLPQEDAKQKEKELIKKYNTQVPNGYNITIGGDINWKSSFRIYCNETEEIFNDEYEAYNAHKEIFKNKYSPELIGDCCKSLLPYLKVPWKNIRYHYQYTKNNMLSSDDIELLCKNKIFSLYKYNKKLISNLHNRYHMKKDRDKYKVLWVDNVCANCGNIYRSQQSSEIGICEKCKNHKIHILK